jgi:hypothetical protein
MTLREQRVLFTRLLCEFGLWCFTQAGIEIAFGEIKRLPAQAKANAASGAGIANSLHLDSLACDIDLYIHGVYQPTSEAHSALGAKWKAMHELNRWGGDFKPRPDGNHYSSTRGGVK